MARYDPPILSSLATLGAAPWVHAWGALNLNAVTDGGFYPFVSESAGLAAASAPLANMPLYAPNGAVIRYMDFLFRTAATDQILTISLVVDNVVQAYSFTVAVGVLVGRINTNFVLAPKASEYLIRPKFTAPVAPAVGTTRPSVVIGAYINP